MSHAIVTVTVLAAVKSATEIINILFLTKQIISRIIRERYVRPQDAHFDLDLQTDRVTLLRTKVWTKDWICKWRDWNARGWQGGRNLYSFLPACPARRPAMHDRYRYAYARVFEIETRSLPP
jgi:hypothetical protein